MNDKNSIFNSGMTFQDILHWIVDRFNDLKDAAIGSFLYFLYGHYYHKKKLYEGIISFFIGTVFAVYTSPVIQTLTGLEIKVVSFAMGLMGMRFTESLFQIDIKDILSRYLNIKFKSEEKPIEKEENI